MVNLVIHTCASNGGLDTFQKTVANPVTVSGLQEYLSESEKFLFEESCPSNMVGVWGEHDHVTWEKISPGDLVVFVGKSEIVASGIVCGKAESRRLAKDFWEYPFSSGGIPFSKIVFLSNLFLENLDKKKAAEALGRHPETVWRFDVLTQKNFQPLLDLLSNPNLSEVTKVDQPSSPSVVYPEFDPEDVEDERGKAEIFTFQRRGQTAFRKRLLQVYEGVCPISGCDFGPALEAAHIVPYQGDLTHSVENGLLLRADFHALFDSGYFCVDPDTFRVRISGDMEESEYAAIKGKGLTVPEKVTKEGLGKALAWHKEKKFLG